MLILFTLLRYIYTITNSSIYVWARMCVYAYAYQYVYEDVDV